VVELTSGPHHGWGRQLERVDGGLDVLDGDGGRVCAGAFGVVACRMRASGISSRRASCASRTLRTVWARARRRRLPGSAKASGLLWLHPVVDRALDRGGGDLRAGHVRQFAARRGHVRVKVMIGCALLELDRRGPPDGAKSAARRAGSVIRRKPTMCLSAEPGDCQPARTHIALCPAGCRCLRSSAVSKRNISTPRLA
jgi:hypothetical protein